MALPTFDPVALYSARIARGWSRAKLGQLADVSDETIRRAEIGRFQPRPETLALLAKALDVSPLDLLTERAA